MASLETKVALIEGHGPPGCGTSPIWIGTVAEYRAANADSLDGDRLQALLDGLDAAGCHRIGGGAEAAFTLIKLIPLRRSGPQAAGHDRSAPQ